MSDEWEKQCRRWRSAVLDACVTGWVFEDKHRDDPQKAIQDLLAWQTKIALDPAVSEEAAKLHAELAALRAQLAEREAELKHLREFVQGVGIVETCTRNDCSDFVRDQVKKALANLKWKLDTKQESEIEAQIRTIGELMDEVDTERQLREELLAEVQGVIDHLPADCVVQVCEGGGPENKAATLAVSVSKLRQCREAAEAEVERLIDALRAALAGKDGASVVQ